MIKALYEMLRAFMRKLRKDTVSAFAAQAAFFVILSFLPFLMIVLTLLKYLPLTPEMAWKAMEGFFPSAVHGLVEVLLREVLSKTSPALLSFSVVAALWSASRGFLVIMQGLNAVYGNKYLGNYFLVRLRSSLYTIGFALMLLLTLGVLVFGNRIHFYLQSKMGFPAELALPVIGLRTVLAFVVLTVYFLVLYLIIPNRKSRIRQELPGAVLSATGWLGFSFLYSLYIDNLSNFSAMYGSLTAVVLCMFWLYACMYIMFIGAEFNVVAADPAVTAAWRAFLGHFRKGRNKNPNKGNTVSKTNRRNRT